jgi:hypothetical protein
VAARGDRHRLRPVAKCVFSSTELSVNCQER